MYTRLHIIRLSGRLVVLLSLASLEGGIAFGTAAAAASSHAPEISVDSADLRVAFNVEPVGPESEYTVALHLTAINQGPDAASGVSLLYEALYGGVVTGAEPADWSCTSETFKVACHRSDLPVGSSQEVVVRVRLHALFGNTISNRFSLSSETFDLNESNNVEGLFIGFNSKDNLNYALLSIVLNQ